ncbi:MAG: Gfo/Idh/MocA family oxidoreductase [Opitutaceae bacterium]
MNSTSNSIPRVGLVGVSGYAGIHLALLRDAQDAGRAEFAAAVVINPDEEVAIVRDLLKRGVKVYSTFDDFVVSEKGRLDLCFVPTGIRWHAPMTVAALRAGMNVLVEKPLAGCVQDADAILDAERETGRFVAVGFQDMYVETTAWLKERLLERAVGELAAIRFIGLWPRSNAYFARNQWAGRLFTDDVAIFDSPFNNALAHFVHLALFLAGEEQCSTASARLVDAELFRAHAIESFDTGVIRARSPGGIDFWFGASHACTVEREPEIHILGSEGRAVWLYDETCTITRFDGAVEKRPVPTAEAARRRMVQSVFRRLTDPSVFIATAKSARAHTVLIDETHRLSSIRTVDPSRIDLVRVGGTESGEMIRAIRDLPDALDRAFINGSTLCSENFSLDELVPRNDPESRLQTS